MKQKNPMSENLNIGKRYYAACVDIICEKVRSDPSVLECPRNQLVTQIRLICGDLAAAQYDGAAQRALGRNEPPGMAKPLDAATKTIDKYSRLLTLRIAQEFGEKLLSNDQTWLVENYPKRNEDRKHFESHVTKCVRAICARKHLFDFAKFRAKIQKILDLEWLPMGAGTVQYRTCSRPELSFRFILPPQVLIPLFRQAA